MHRNISKTLVVIFLILIFTSCENNQEHETTTVSEVAKSTENTTVETTTSIYDIPVDIDLSAMNLTMTYSSLANMQYEYDSLSGQTVRMSGIFYVFEDMGNRYFLCLVNDAAICCPVGLEFDLGDEYSYPEDYPAIGTFITIVGTLNYYTENEEVWLKLHDTTIWYNQE
ncbi:MAG TPA: hypothetical protein GXZ23_07420 [Clostridiales bacterium]|nr:hypothetical protein [Clostridiales bacterium]